MFFFNVIILNGKQTQFYKSKLECVFIIIIYMKNENGPKEISN